MVLGRANIATDVDERDLSDLLVVMTTSSALNFLVLRLSLAIPLV